MPSSILTLPGETIDNVCSLTSSRSDVLNLSLTCRTLRDAALHSLYRVVSLVVNDSETSLERTQIYVAVFKRPDIASSIRSISLADDDYHSDYNERLYRTFSNAAREDTSYSNLNFRTVVHPLFEDLRSLTEVRFRRMHLDTSAFDTLYRLTCSTLRSLSLRGCDLHIEHASINTDIIKLEELQILEMKLHEGIIGLGELQVSDVRFKAIDSLFQFARAPELRVLDLDHTTDRCLPSLIEHGIPSGLTTLVINLKNFFPEISDFPIHNFIAFLYECRSLTHFHIIDLPRAMRFFTPQRSRLPAFIAVSSTWEFARAFISQATKSLRLIDRISEPLLYYVFDAVDEHSIEDLFYHLHECGNIHLCLRSMSQRSPRVKSIRISLSENLSIYYLSIIPLIPPYNYENLKTLRIYCANRSFHDCVDKATQHQQVLQLSRKIPTLTEIALHRETIWSKSESELEGGAWTPRSTWLVSAMDEENLPMCAKF